MSENTKLWDTLGKTDPKHTKPFKRAGGFKGTAIKPMWSYRRMTEEFGPCGKGWGVGQPHFDVVPAGDEVLVYCTATVWWDERGSSAAADDYCRHYVYGVGGDKVVSNFSTGLRSDDEAFKKAFTDAVTNALKMIGVGADVHMGMFDDSKYVNTMQQEFAEEPPEEPAKSSAQLKREEAWPRMMFEISASIGDCKTLVSLNRLKEELREKARKERWNGAFLETLKDELEAHENRIRSEQQAAAEAEAAALDREMLRNNPIMAG